MTGQRVWAGFKSRPRLIISGDHDSSSSYRNRCRDLVDQSGRGRSCRKVARRCKQPDDGRRTASRLERAAARGLVVGDMFSDQTGCERDRFSRGARGWSFRADALVGAARQLKTGRAASHSVERVRSSAEAAYVRETVGSESLRRLAGNPALEGFTVTKLLWMKEHEPQLFDRISHMLLAKDYIRYRLTGELGSEPSDASATLLFSPGSLMIL